MRIFIGSILILLLLCGGCGGEEPEPAEVLPTTPYPTSARIGSGELEFTTPYHFSWGGGRLNPPSGAGMSGGGWRPTE